MRILWMSAAPWAPTGYGQQTAAVVPRLRELGHDVAIFAQAGLNFGPVDWHGIPVLPALHDRFGQDILDNHLAWWKADALISLFDLWVLNPLLLAETAKNVKVAHWLPVDCDPLGSVDKACLGMTGATAIPMSAHGERMCAQAGVKHLPHIPHGVDTQVFVPPQDRAALRQSRGLPPDRFIIGINAANLDTTRKGYPEQFRAFARFHGKHPGSLLLVHAIAKTQPGIDLAGLANGLGIGDAVIFTPQDDLMGGRLDTGWMLGWYGCLDVLSNCSYGEGFGIPLVEAQACGVPVVTTRHPPMSDLIGAGWAVDCQPWWNNLHESWWHVPLVDSIARAYEKAFTMLPRRRREARQFALAYDTGKLMPLWEAALCSLAG